MKRSLFVNKIIVFVFSFLLIIIAGWPSAYAEGSTGSYGSASVSSVSSVSAVKKPDEMKVHFIDVGQGDSTLITCGGEAMLIDAGDTDKGTAVQLYLKKQKVTRLKYLVLTHPDSDHIGGAPVIITKFSVGTAYVSDYTKTNKVYENLMQAFKYRELKPVVPKVGSSCSLGTAEITFLAPVNKYDNPNDSSIALIIQDGEKRFLFTGDAGEAAEKDIVDTGIDISADVYQVGHHGSRYSSGSTLLDAVNPTDAVISCGKGNSYGHPHSETLNKFREAGIDVYRTDEEGTIIATTDGSRIRWNVPASVTWQAGEPEGTGSGSEKNTGAGAADSSSSVTSAAAAAVTPSGTSYVVNTNTGKFHLPSCSSVDQMSPVNRKDVTCSREELIKEGYVPCKRCNP